MYLYSKEDAVALAQSITPGCVTGVMVAWQLSAQVEECHGLVCVGGTFLAAAVISGRHEGTNGVTYVCDEIDVVSETCRIPLQLDRRLR
jgi:hypothetical protein